MLNQINFYQFDNLINNRVPFLFLNMSGHSLCDWYSSVSKVHVQTYEILVPENEALSTIQDKKAPPDYAIVLLCADGFISLKMQQQLEKMSYTNVYVVHGGYQQIVTERDQI